MPVRHRRTGARASRRKTTWATHSSSEVFAAANDLHTVNLLDQYQTAGGSIAGITIARTHLRMVVTAPAAGPAAGDRINLGILRGQDTDVGVNIAGAPSPSAKLFEDWALWTQYDACVMPGAGAHYGVGGSNCLAIDLRAKRKLPELQMTWNWAVHVSATMTIQLSARTLILLP